MNFKYLLIFILLLTTARIFSQRPDTLNRTDTKGLKQGHWIKKYPNGHIQYAGYFKDNHPTGLFKRYYDTDTLQSVLEFNADGTDAEAILFHPNGFIASTGKFINQLKEGKWKFFSSSIKGFLVSEEEYSDNIRNGISIKYYPDNIPAEKLNYLNDMKDGEWIQYFPSGNVCLKASYLKGKLDGAFSTYYTDGRPEYIGQYKNDQRNGIWKVFNPDGSVKYNMEYTDGIVSNPEIYKKETDYLDLMEKNKGKIADPEKTGTIW